MENLKFKLKLTELPVEIENEDGTVSTYILKEMDGSQRSTFLNDSTRRIKLKPNGEPESVSDYKHMQENALTLCLYDPDGKLVPVNVLEKWPGAVLTALYKAAQELSGMNKEDEAKNE